MRLLPASILSILLVVPHASFAQQFSKTGDAPGPRFNFGFEQRVRSENWNNIMDYSDKADDEREQIRYRTRVWASMPLLPHTDFYVGLNQETNQKLGKVTQFDEVIFDQFYLDVNKLFMKGLSLRIGRQNMQRGEGFILFDGGASDGSRAAYFNGVDLAYEFKKSKLELIGILDPSRDRFLPRIHDQRKCLQDWDEQALGFYYTDNNLPRTSFETYYFYKKEVTDILPVTNPQYQPDRHLSTFGGRVVHKLTSTLSLTGELAHQWGVQHGNIPISAWGGYGYARKTLKRRWNPYLQAGFWGLSGSDPNDPNRIGNWDPLFNRWPAWSELYIYSQVREAGVAYWTNLWMPSAEVGFSPNKATRFRFTYYSMNAFHPFNGSKSIFGTGTHRGDNLQARFDFTMNRSLRGHILVENHTPGAFYANGKDGYFIRGELIYTVRSSVAASKMKQLVGLGRSQPAAQRQAQGL